MSQLRILDLSFCDSEIASIRKVEGGLTFGVSVSNSTGAFANSASSSNSSRYSVSNFFNPITGAYSYTIGYGYAGAVAGSASGAAGDGYKYATAYTGTSTY